MCGRNSRMFSSFSFRCCLVVKRAHLIFCISHIRWKLLQFPRFYPPNEIKSIIISRGVHLQFFVFARRWNLQPADIWYSVYNWIEFKCYVHRPYATSGLQLYSYRRRRSRRNIQIRNMRLMFPFRIFSPGNVQFGRKVFEFILMTTRMNYAAIVCHTHTCCVFFLPLLPCTSMHPTRNSNNN